MIFLDRCYLHISPAHIIIIPTRRTKIHAIFSELTDGISQACQQKGYRLKLIQINENIDNIQKWIEDIRITDCAGIILLGTEISLSAAKIFLSLSLPIVLLDSHIFNRISSHTDVCRLFIF